MAIMPDSFELEEVRRRKKAEEEARNNRKVEFVNEAMKNGCPNTKLAEFLFEQFEQRSHVHHSHPDPHWI